MTDGIRIQVTDVQAWIEPTKLNVGSIESTLDAQVENYVIASLEPGFATTAWVDPTTTPEIIKQVMAMKYASVIYDRNYSEDSDTTSPWSARLDTWAEDLIQGMLDGSVTIDGYVAAAPHADPVGYPNDVSSTPFPPSSNSEYCNVQWAPNDQWGDPGAQPPAFSVGMRF
jgi:hypothetical protein